MTTWSSERVFEEILIPLLSEVEEDLGMAIPRQRSTPLLGEDSDLDSLAVVTLLISAEERLQDELGRPVKLVDEQAMSRRASPFRTLGTLADYIAAMLGPSQAVAV